MKKARILNSSFEIRNSKFNLRSLIDHRRPARRADLPLGRTRVRPPALETAQLDVDVCLLIEKLGCDICPVRPSNRSVFSDLETSEILNVFERLEDGPPELGAEV